MQTLKSITPAPNHYRTSAFANTVDNIKGRWAQVYLQVKFFGYSHTMDDYEQRKLRLFNQINFFSALAGFLVPLLAMVLPGNIPGSVWAAAFWPAGVSVLVLALNYLRHYQASLFAYFLLYPVCTCLVYLNGLNPGIELHFIFFIILAVFLVQNMGFMLFSSGLCLISFYILSVVLTNFTYEAEKDNKLIYLLNKAVSLSLIFYGLFLVKRENTVYQFNILGKQKHLQAKNVEIENQKEVISHKAQLLEEQKTELADLNAFKNKLFSIIAHDLKSPLYALRNLFQNMHQYNLPGEEIKEMVPDVLADLNYTTALMENLLQWAKSQMQSEAVYPQKINLGLLLTEVAKLLRLQTENKNITLSVTTTESVYVNADKDMIHLVLRNLLSNAIKFTPAGGKISMGTTMCNGNVQVFVQDSGLGISSEGLQKIKQNIFYTTTGTASETGTGLGLMLCHEFLARNGSSLSINSKVGIGSRFSFALPATEQ